jgi:hypothetical protein
MNNRPSFFAVESTLAQLSTPNRCLIDVDPTLGERGKINHDHPSTLPTLCRRWFNVCLLTGLMDTLDFNKRDINIFISETWQKYAGDCSKLQDVFFVRIAM